MADPATHSIIASASPSLSQSRSRLQRFADWGDILDIDEPSTTASGESRSSGGLNTFYSGQGVAERLRIIRDAIVYVRRNWKDYGMLMDGFKELLKKRLGDPLPTTGDEGYYSDRLLASSKRWRDGFTSQEGEDDEEYSAIRLYTSEYGFEEIFKMVDNILRTNDTSPEHLSDINSAVFLVELMNVDLFNYVSVAPEANNYQGVVFRGLAATEEQIRNFEELARRSVPERFWAVPLALVSASRDREMALAFARLEVQGQEDEKPKRRLFLWRIHVVELEPELLQVYRERHPTSVVSTICAVPVRELSAFPEEDEVVLRGPLFQLVRMEEEDVEGVGKVYVMDSVMVSVNRDHPSTMEEGNEARELIGCLVCIGRARVCKRLAEEFGLEEDVYMYEQQIEEYERLKSSLVSDS